MLRHYKRGTGRYYHVVTWVHLTSTDWKQRGFLLPLFIAFLADMNLSRFDMLRFLRSGSFLQEGSC